jgi:hypothetical protein
MLLLELEIVHEDRPDAGGNAVPPPMKARAVVGLELANIADHLTLAAVNAPAAP